MKQERTEFDKRLKFVKLKSATWFAFCSSKIRERKKKEYWRIPGSVPLQQRQLC